MGSRSSDQSLAQRLNLFNSPQQHRLAGAARALSQGETEVEPSTAARTFARDFARLHGGGGLAWTESGWQDATAAAARQYKFLFVYLHAADHDDTPKFCAETLTAPEVRQQVVCISMRFSEKRSFARRQCRFLFVHLHGRP